MNLEKHGMSRRSFLRGVGVACVALPALDAGAGLLAGCTASTGAEQSSPVGAAGSEYSWRTVLTKNDEPGEPLLVSGRVFGPDGRTPLSGALIHVYHTDARGIYSEEDGNGRAPNPRIKGWMKTDESGRYEFRTIKPASYPGSRNPAHIHSKVSAPGYAERWIPEFWFEGDPFITPESASRYTGLKTFSPIMAVKRGGDALLLCTRDIRLEKV